MLAEPFVNVLDVTSTTGRHYARVFASFRNAGTPIPLNDVWIAACTLECHGRPLSFDGDFMRVPALECTLLEGP